ERANSWGGTKDLVSIGKGSTTLDAIVGQVAQSQDRVVTGDRLPDRGFFYRADQVSFAKIGVPAVYLRAGIGFIGRPEGWGREQHEANEKHNYHQPSDEIASWWNFDGTVEDADLGFRVGLQIANADEMPSWVPVDEFAAARK